MAWCKLLPQRWIYAGQLSFFTTALYKLFRRNLLATIEFHIKRELYYISRRASVDWCAGPGARVERGQQSRPAAGPGAARVKLPSLWGSDRERGERSPGVSWEGSRGRRGRTDKIWKLSGDSKSDPVSVGVLSFHGKVKVKPGSRPLVGFSVEFSKCSHRRWPSYWR